LGQHVAIRRADYVAGNRDRPEVGVFTQTHSARPPVPWNRIAIGDEVWMKWSGGPMVGHAIVEGFRQIENASPELLRATTAGYKLHELQPYWISLPPRFFGMTIYLKTERWLDEPFIPGARSRGESWIVLERPELIGSWLQAGSVPSESRGPLAARPRRGSRTVNVTLRFEVLRRDNFHCTYCGRGPPDTVLHIDHVVPWSAGGRTVIDNLRTVCLDCNLGKGANKLTPGRR
jgi:hypothetical protein